MTGWKRLCLVLSAVLILAACQREVDGPLRLSGKIFIFNIRLADAYYQITLDRTGTLADGSLVTAEFENPAGGPVLVARQAVFPSMRRIDLRSPSLTCVRKDRAYTITIRVTDAAGKTVQTIETTLVSTLDQSVMPAKPLVKGPAYDANEAATGQDGTIIMADLAKCPT